MKYKNYFVGELVEPVLETNDNLEYGLSDIIGVTIDKRMITTIANLKETSLEKFILVKKNYFVYNPRTHGKRIGLGFNKNDKTYISTWNNNVFKVKQNAEEKILPEYLYLCFCRDIWDKEACFRSWGSSTVVLSWDSFCSIQVSVPSIDEQKKIIKKYNLLESAIDNKRKLIKNLDLVASNVFYECFYSKIDNKDWKEYSLGSIALISAGGDKPENYSEVKTENYTVPIYSNGIEKDGLFGFTDIPKIKKESITISARGTVGYVFLRTKPFVPIVRLLTITPIKDNLSAGFLYYYFKQMSLNGNGTSQQQITVPDMKKMTLILPDDQTLKYFEENTSSIFKLIDVYKNEIEIYKKIIHSLVESKL